MSLPLPRSVGIASEDELLLVELERPEVPAQVLHRLARQVPKGLLLREAFAIPCKARPHPVEVTYHLDNPSDDCPDLGHNARRILTADHIEVHRTTRKSRHARPLDVRGWIVAIDVQPHATLFTLRTGPDGSAKPAEVLELLGLAPIDTLPRLRRLAVRWEELEPSRSSQDPPASPL
jgi:hypothetical protein